MKSKVTSKTYNHLSLAEIKQHLRVSPSFLDDDAMLNSLLIVATEIVENYIENVVALTTLETTVKDFSGTILKVKKGNFHSLQAITFTDRFGQVHTLSGDVGYTVEEEEFHFSIEFDQYVDTEKLVINHISGFSASSIPGVIKQATLIKVTSLYDIERSEYNSSGFQLNKAFENLLNYHKKINIF